MFFGGKFIDSRNLRYDPADGKNTTDISFDGLNYGNSYNVCLETSGLRSFNDKKKCREDNPNQKCRVVETACVQLPVTKKIPSQVNWSDGEDSFNPFTEIKIRMEQGTFEGEKSGLSKFTIR